MTGRSVPSKIVIAGNSRMSLNDRFARLPKARPQFQQQRSAYQQQVDYVVPRVKKNQIRKTKFVPIDQRISFHKAPKIVYVPVAGALPTRRNPKFFGGRNNNMSNQPIKNFKPNNFRQKPQFKKQNGLNNNNTGSQKPFPPRKPKFGVATKKSVADLDKELDDYMRKSKHTPITI